jgi:hypothetical protein
MSFWEMVGPAFGESFANESKIGPSKLTQTKSAVSKRESTESLSNGWLLLEMHKSPRNISFIKVDPI